MLNLTTWMFSYLKNIGLNTLDWFYDHKKTRTYNENSGILLNLHFLKLIFLPAYCLCLCLP